MNRYLGWMGVTGAAVAALACQSPADGPDPFAAAGVYVADSIMRFDNDLLTHAELFGASFTVTLTRTGTMTGTLSLPAHFGPIQADTLPFQVSFTGTWQQLGKSVYMYPQPAFFLSAQAWTVSGDTLRVGILTDAQPSDCFCSRAYQFRSLRTGAP